MPSYEARAEARCVPREAAATGPAGYTRGMKTAISVPDALFAEVEQLVRRSGRARSEVYSAALREYVSRHAPDTVTDAIDAAVDQVGEPSGEERRFSDAAARRVLATTEW